VFARGAAFGNFAEAFVAVDEEATEGQGGLFEGVVGVGEAEPAGEAGAASGGEEFDGAKRGEFFANGISEFRKHSDPDAVVADGFGIVALAKDENDLCIHIDRVRAEHGAGADAAREGRIFELVEDEGESWRFLEAHGFRHGKRLDALDEDHFGLRSGLAEGFGGGVFGGIPPFAGDFGGGKFDDDDSARRPVSFQDFHFAAANEEAAAIGLDGGENGFAVVLVPDGVVDFDADENIGGHFAGLLRIERDFNAEFAEGGEGRKSKESSGWASSD